jgi:hypothetical protein
LLASDPSTGHVRAVKRFTARMRAIERAVRTSYAWPVSVRAPGGGSRRIAGP